MARKIITELFWRADCSCGWKTEAKNDADSAGNKVRNHLMTFHREEGATIHLSSWQEQRLEGQLPAMGVPV